MVSHDDWAALDDSADNSSNAVAVDQSNAPAPPTDEITMDAVDVPAPLVAEVTMDAVDVPAPLVAEVTMDAVDVPAPAPEAMPSSEAEAPQAAPENDAKPDIAADTSVEPSAKDPDENMSNGGGRSDDGLDGDGPADAPRQRADTSTPAEPSPQPGALFNAHVYVTPPARGNLVDSLVGAGTQHQGITYPIVNGREVLHSGDNQVAAIRGALHPPIIETIDRPDGRHYVIVEPGRNVASAVSVIPEGRSSGEATVSVIRLAMRQAPDDVARAVLVALDGLPDSAEVTLHVTQDAAMQARTAAHETGHVDDVRRDFGFIVGRFDEAIRELAGHEFSTRQALEQAVMDRAGLSNHAFAQRAGLADEAELLQYFASKGLAGDLTDRLALSLHLAFSLAQGGRDNMRELRAEETGEGVVHANVSLDPEHLALTVHLYEGRR